MVVGRSPQVRDRTDAGAFVVFGEPLPVGTSLVLKIDDKDQHARVTEVVESADASAAGMRVRFVKPGEKAAPAPAPAARAAAARERAPPPPARRRACERARRSSAARTVRARRGRRSRRPTYVRDRVGTRSRSRRRGRGRGRIRGFGGVPSSGDASAQHAADSHGHHDGEHGRRKRRRK